MGRRRSGYATSAQSGRHFAFSGLHFCLDEKKNGLSEYPYKRQIIRSEASEVEKIFKSQIKSETDANVQPLGVFARGSVMNQKTADVVASTWLRRLA